MRERYETDIDTAADLLVKAAANTDAGSAPAARDRHAQQAAAAVHGPDRAGPRQQPAGLPLGGAYLRYANEQMQTADAARRPRSCTRRRTERLRADYADATPVPVGRVGLGVVALGALAWAQRRNYRRTNRVFNHGPGSPRPPPSTVVLLWLAVGPHASPASGLNDSYDHGVRSLNVLNDARIASLKARGNENLTLVAPRAPRPELADKTSSTSTTTTIDRRLKALGEGPRARPADLADDAAGRQPVTRPHGEHEGVAGAAQGGPRRPTTPATTSGALAQVIGADEEPDGRVLRQVDETLGQAIDARAERVPAEAAEDGRGALTGLPVGAASSPCWARRARCWASAAGFRSTGERGTG